MTGAGFDAPCRAVRVRRNAEGKMPDVRSESMHLFDGRPALRPVAPPKEQQSGSEYNSRRRFGHGVELKRQVLREIGDERGAVAAGYVPLWGEGAGVLRHERRDGVVGIVHHVQPAGHRVVLKMPDREAGWTLDVLPRVDS